MERSAGADTAKSTEQHAVRLADEQAEQAHAQQMVDRLRQKFIERKDNVNLIWLDETLAGETDMRKMAQKSGRDVQDFYAASKRRARIVADLLAAESDVAQDEGKGSCWPSAPRSRSGSSWSTRPASRPLQRRSP